MSATGRGTHQCLAVEVLCWVEQIDGNNKMEVKPRNLVVCTPLFLQPCHVNNEEGVHHAGSCGAVASLRTQSPEKGMQEDMPCAHRREQGCASSGLQGRWVLQ